MRKIAVTGGLASGKTSVCRILKDCGAYVVSADEIVHQLLSPESPLGKRIIEEFGSDIIHDNQIDRGKVARLVFTNPEKLQSLENLIHPIVFHEIENRYQKITQQKTYKLFVAEIPLLYESNMESFYDAVIAVIADPRLCMQRFQASKGYAPDEYDKRMERQLSHEQKAARADYVLINNGSLEELKEQVLKLVPDLI